MALVAPIAQHRVTFRMQDKHYVVRSANQFALAGLVFLAVAMTAAVTLVTSSAFGTVAGVLCAAGATLAFAACWGMRATEPPPRGELSHRPRFPVS